MGALANEVRAALEEAIETSARKLEAAALEAKLKSEALDVTVPEPLPPDSPLWDVPNLLLTPHVAGGMRLEITRRRCVEMAQENLRRYLAGEELVNVVK